MREIWKSIPGWEGLYVVSNLARVKHLPYTKGKGKHVYSETILKPYKNNTRNNKTFYCENWFFDSNRIGF